MSKEVNLDELKFIDWSPVRGTPRECKNCNKIFYKRAENNCHNPCIKETSFFTKKPRRYTCMLNGIDGHECDVEKRTACEMQDHLQAVLKEFSYRCNHCSEEFILKRSLFNHIRSRHLSQPCPVKDCKIKDRFLDQELWVEHVTKVHEMTIHGCTICRCLLTSEKGLKAHTKTVHKEKMHE